MLAPESGLLSMEVQLGYKIIFLNECELMSQINDNNQNFIFGDYSTFVMLLNLFIMIMIHLGPL